MNRKRPAGSSGVLAALLIAPRTFSYCVCPKCLRNLYYTYRGEECPFCDAVVDWYVEGTLVDDRGGRIDFRAGALARVRPRRVGRGHPGEAARAITF